MKDSLEEVFFKRTGLSFKTNALITFSIIALCYLPAIFISSIGDAITIAGCTINPVVNYISLNLKVGFILPTMFYWKAKSDLKATSP